MLGGREIHYPTEEIEWAPLPITSDRKGTLLLKGNRKGPHAIGRKKQSINPSLLYSMTTKYKYLLPLL